MNLENMNRKEIAQNQNIIAGAFFVFFLIGLWVTRFDLFLYASYSIQIVLFHAILLLNTYFSIQCFGRVTPPDDRWQWFFDAVLIVIYATSPFMMTQPVIYLLLMMSLFLIASLKYVRLIGEIHDTVLVKRKITIDLTGVFWNFAMFFFCLIQPVWTSSLLWIWLIVFAVSNYYLLKIKPMYCLTSP
jgi:hypothetical protein